MNGKTKCFNKNYLKVYWRQYFCEELNLSEFSRHQCSTHLHVRNVYCGELVQRHIKAM